MVQLLVKYGGININLKNSLGRILLSIAKVYRDIIIVQLLLKCEINGPKSID